MDSLLLLCFELVFVFVSTNGMQSRTNKMKAQLLSDFVKLSISANADVENDVTGDG